MTETVTAKVKIPECACDGCESFRADLVRVNDDKSYTGRGDAYIRVTDIEYLLKAGTKGFIERVVGAGYGRRGVLTGHPGRRPRIVRFEVRLSGRFPVFHPGSCDECGKAAYGVWSGPGGDDVMFCYGCADKRGCY
jgi:hypothetical protein